MKPARATPAIALAWSALAVACCGSNSDGADAGDAAMIAPDVAPDATPDVAGPACLGAGRASPGGPCGCDDDCELGDRCGTQTESGFPGGVCLHSCDPAQPAPMNYLCGGDQPGYNALVRACGGSLPPCRPGWSCAMRTGGPRCEPQCSSDAQCADGARCDPYSGLCNPTAGAGTGGLNAACARGEECRSNQCTNFGATAGGACTSECNINAPVCPENGVCVLLSTTPGVTTGLCLVPCASPSECRAGFQCLRTPSGRGGCVPQV